MSGGASRQVLGRSESCKEVLMQSVVCCVDWDSLCFVSNTAAVVAGDGFVVSMVIVFCVLPLRYSLLRKR